MVKCGYCQSRHANVAAVRACAKSTVGLRVDIEEVERELHEMEAVADRAESYREERAKADWKEFAESAHLNGMSALLNEVDELLCTKEIPERDGRWARAVRAMISGPRSGITEFGLRTAIERLGGYPNVRAGGRSSGRPVPANSTQPGGWNPSKVVEREGLYRLSRNVTLEWVEYAQGTLVQAIYGKDSGKLYAKIVHLPETTGKRPTLEYVRGLIFKLQDDELLPVEDAQGIARKFGWCVFGHFLTNPKSIARGMGPKCFERYPHLAKGAVA